MTNTRSHGDIARHALACVAALGAALSLACSDVTPTSPTTRLAPPSPNTDRAQPAWSFDTLDVPGAIATIAEGINARGDIVGYYVDAAKYTHGFLLHDGTYARIDYTDPVTGAVADNTDARGIGPDGDIVGAHWNTGEEAVADHGYRRAPDGTFTPVHIVGHLNEIPQRILPDGTILGCRHDHDTMGSMRGIMIRGADTVDMSNLYASMANGASPDGRLVVGLYTNMMVTPARGEAFVIADGDTTAFIVPGSTFTAAWDVNPRGDVVGVYKNATGGRHGFVRTEAGFTSIDIRDASETRTFSINARGDVVGLFVVGTGKAAVTHGYHGTRVR